eukprot:6187163-Pleurochrysis_carterae.AAC.1
MGAASWVSWAHACWRHLRSIPIRRLLPARAHRKGATRPISGVVGCVRVRCASTPPLRPPPPPVTDVGS